MTVHAAGYQGDASILTRAMGEWVQMLRDQGGCWHDLAWLPNVTAQGETAASLFDSVERNARQLCYMASGYLSHRVPELQVLDLPFAHPDRVALFEALDATGGAQLAGAIGQRTGYVCLGFWDNGQRHISNAVRPITGPDDAQGIAIRTLDSALYRASLNAMGFEARTCDVKDLVPWVRQGIVQAQENPLTNYLGFELWRDHPYVSLTGHFWGALLLLCPAPWYHALAPSQREQLHQAADRATRLQRQWAAGEDERAMAQLTGLGVQWVHADQIDLVGFQSSVAAVRAAVVRDLPKALVQAFGLS
jgi:TRAP-type transport system periplasmic protein